jgi:hypothetical protein
MQPLAVFYIAAQITERLVEPISLIGQGLSKQVRAILLWIVASGIGIAIAEVAKLALFKASGIGGVDPGIDYILTGIAIGSGTKPIHDVISYLQKASEKGSP